MRQQKLQTTRQFVGGAFESLLVLINGDCIALLDDRNKGIFFVCGLIQLMIVNLLHQTQNNVILIDYAIYIIIVSMEVMYVNDILSI